MIISLKSGGAAAPPAPPPRTPMEVLPFLSKKLLTLLNLQLSIFSQLIFLRDCWQCIFYVKLLSLNIHIRLNKI